MSMEVSKAQSIPWRAQQWVTSKGPVLNVDLWIELLELLDVSVASYEWIKVPSHVQLEGSERADALATCGRDGSMALAVSGVPSAKHGHKIRSG